MSRKNDRPSWGAICCKRKRVERICRDCAMLRRSLAAGPDGAIHQMDARAVKVYVRYCASHPEDRHEAANHGTDRPWPLSELAPCERLQRRDCAAGEGNVRKSAPAAPTAPQSVGAQLGHQPTPESVRRAEAASTSGVNDILNRAKALDADRKTKECMDLVATARLRLQ
jgi:hypothetical protein